MTRREVVRGLFLAGSALLALAGSGGKLEAQIFGSHKSCGDCYSCQRFHCPPHLKHCTEGPPRICYQHGCPKPICNPCMAPMWGYYQTCWTPWPWPPDWSHCPVQPPAAVVFPGLLVPGSRDVEDPLAPRKLRPGM